MLSILPRICNSIKINYKCLIELRSSFDTTITCEWDLKLNGNKNRNNKKHTRTINIEFPKFKMADPSWRTENTMNSMALKMHTSSRLAAFENEVCNFNLPFLVLNFFNFYLTRTGYRGSFQTQGIFSKFLHFRELDVFITKNKIFVQIFLQSLWCALKGEAFKSVQEFYQIFFIDNSAF